MPLEEIRLRVYFFDSQSIHIVRSLETLLSIALTVLRSGYKELLEDVKKLPASRIKIVKDRLLRTIELSRQFIKEKEDSFCLGPIPEPMHTLFFEETIKENQKPLPKELFSTFVEGKLTVNKVNRSFLNFVKNLTIEIASLNADKKIVAFYHLKACLSQIRNSVKIILNTDTHVDPSLHLPN